MFPFRRGESKVEREMRKSEKLQKQSDMLHARAVNQAAKGHLYQASRLENRSMRKDVRADIHERKAERVADYQSHLLHHSHDRHGHEVVTTPGLAVVGGAAVAAPCTAAVSHSEAEMARDGAQADAAQVNAAAARDNVGHVVNPSQPHHPAQCATSPNPNDTQPPPPYRLM